MSSSRSRAKIAAVGALILGAALAAVFLLRRDPPLSASSKPAA
jgi:hypothetical protein